MCLPGSPRPVHSFPGEQRIVKAVLNFLAALPAFLLFCLIAIIMKVTEPRR